MVFLEGDLVFCIEPVGPLKDGEIYKVRRYYSDPYINGEYLDLFPYYNGWSSNRFIKATKNVARFYGKV